MNVCLLSGRVCHHATLRGNDPKTLTFLLETRNGSAEGKERPAFGR